MIHSSGRLLALLLLSMSIAVQAAPVQVTSPTPDPNDVPSSPIPAVPSSASEAARGDTVAPPPDPFARFAPAIAAFQKKEKDLGVVNGGVLFIGSSSIRHWDTAASFPKFATVNHGFGGSGISDVLHYYPQLVSVYRPDVVIIYIGENDIVGDQQRLTDRILTLLERLHGDFPQARIAYLSLKPGSARWQYWPKMQAINATIKQQADQARHFDYIDVATPLLGPDGLPNDTLFLGDHIHLNPAGYVVWNAIVEDYLEKKAPALQVVAGGGKVVR